MAKHLGYRTVAGARRLLYATITGNKHLALDCIEEGNDCCRCGLCCFSENSTIDVNWDFQGENNNCATLDLIRTGIMEDIPLASFNCDEDGLFTSDATWEKTAGGVKVTIYLVCSDTATEWGITVEDVANSRTIESTNTFGGDCCGATVEDLQTNNSVGCTGDNAGNDVVITVSLNNCCRDEANGCVSGTALCDGTCDEGI